MEQNKCPYCCKLLEKIPSRKTKCPHCGNFIYVKESYDDNKRWLVTEKEKEKINEEWFIYRNPLIRDYVSVIEEREFIKAKEIFRKKLGREPKEGEYKWGVMNQHLLKFAMNKDWQFYSSVTLEMAEILRFERKFEQALIFYLQSCYIDLNGPSNMGGERDPEILKEFPPFNPELGQYLLSPALVDMVRSIAKKLELNEDRVKSIFLGDLNQKQYRNLKLPLSPEQCWRKLEPKLFGKNEEKGGAKMNNQFSSENKDFINAIKQIKDDPDNNEGETKKCPFCAEIIKKEAVKCRFCGSDLVRETYRASKDIVNPRIGKNEMVNGGVITIIGLIIFLLSLSGPVFVGIFIGAITFIVGLCVYFTGKIKHWYHWK